MMPAFTRSVGSPVSASLPILLGALDGHGTNEVRRIIEGVRHFLKNLAHGRLRKCAPAREIGRERTPQAGVEACRHDSSPEI
jgi:hypothetical protein